MGDKCTPDSSPKPAEFFFRNEAGFEPLSLRSGFFVLFGKVMILDERFVFMIESIQNSRIICVDRGFNSSFHKLTKWMVFNFFNGVCKIVARWAEL